MVQIAALVLPDMFLSSLAPLVDAFRLTRERGERMLGPEAAAMPDFRLTLVSVDGADVSAGNHATVRVDQAIASTDRFDCIWIPAFRAYGEGAMRNRLAASRPVLDWLRSCAAGGTLIGASASAVALPMAAGLAQKIRVPIAEPLAPVFRALFPRHLRAPDMAVVEQGSLLLSPGMGHDIEAVTRIFSRFFSPESGRWITSVFGRDGLALDDVDAHPAHDPLVERARIILEQRFSTSISITDLAAELCVSHAVLLRHFRRELDTTPSRYVQGLRLAAAKRMLLQSRRSVEAIAATVGYGDARIFREMFRKATGLSASEWRRTERARDPGKAANRIHDAANAPP